MAVRDLQAAPEFPARFTDNRGTDAATFATDGRLFRLAVRGHTFVGSTLDSLRPVDVDVDDDRSASEELPFDFYLRSVTVTELTSTVPVTIVRDGREQVIEARLRFVGGPDGTYRSEPATSLAFEFDGTTYRATSAHLEGVFVQLEKQLPQGVELRCCYSCGLSGYQHAGDGLSGMLCFRDLKEQYLQVRTKRDYIPLERQATEFVQEFYLCPEWIPRRPGVGYR